MLGEQALYLDRAPLDWLLPRVSAVVHHGGMGTAALALVSGRPQVVCPLNDGQRFCAERMYASGVASPPQPQTSLNSTDLAAAIREAVDTPTLSARAQEVADNIGTEQGVETAVKILEDVVRSRAKAI